MPRTNRAHCKSTSWRGRFARCTHLGKLNRLRREAQVAEAISRIEYLSDQVKVLESERSAALEEVARQEQEQVCFERRVCLRLIPFCCQAKVRDAFCMVDDKASKLKTALVKLRTYNSSLKNDLDMLRKRLSAELKAKVLRRGQGAWFV